MLNLLKTNILKTLLVNFRLLPFHQAIKLPLFVYGNFMLRSSEGHVVINGNIHSGMIKIGRHDRYPETHIPKTIWVINGEMVFNGTMSFFHGSYIMIAHNAKLVFGKGDHPACGANIRIMCFDNIVIEDAHITWDCQIMDSSFHYIESINERDGIQPLTRPVFLGKHVWVGNRTTITAGAIVPDETIIASNSLVNKDYRSIGSNCMIAGIPASLKKKGVRRIYDKADQAAIDSKFGYDRTRL